MGDMGTKYHRAKTEENENFGLSMICHSNLLQYLVSFVSFPLPSNIMVKLFFQLSIIPLCWTPHILYLWHQPVVSVAYDTVEVQLLYCVGDETWF